jgi:hypothetical protein
MRDFTERDDLAQHLRRPVGRDAQLIWPEHRNTFFYGSWNWPGQKKTWQQVDASGMLALHRFAAISDSLLTPANSQWHTLEANDDYVMKDRATRLWFDTSRGCCSSTAQPARELPRAEQRELPLARRLRQRHDVRRRLRRPRLSRLQGPALQARCRSARPSSARTIRASSTSIIRWFRLTARRRRRSGARRRCRRRSKPRSRRAASGRSTSCIA